MISHLEDINYVMDLRKYFNNGCLVRPGNRGIVILCLNVLDNFGSDCDVNPLVVLPSILRIFVVGIMNVKTLRGMVRYTVELIDK